jgi:hypothetical protein
MDPRRSYATARATTLYVIARGHCVVYSEESASPSTTQPGSIGGR